MDRIFYLGWLLLFTPSLLFANEFRYTTRDADVIIPESSMQTNNNVGHTDLIVTKPHRKLINGLPYGETPASIACVYGLTKQVKGCPIETTTALPTGGWGTIALIDAYYDADAETDLNVFSSQFGLRQCTTANGCFRQVNLGGSTPGWEDEQSLDIEWAHAMAPNANILLVEAASGSLTDLLTAVQYATTIVSQTGGIISGSWSFSEFQGEASLDGTYQHSGLIYIASAGDYSAPARYPSSSPFVISAGGTTIVRDVFGNLVGEAAWSKKQGIPPGEKSGGSGGPSAIEPRPAFQDVIQKIVGTHRGTPDIAFDADPKSGVLVYSSFRGGWIVDGGTSVSSPALAGIINSANHRAPTTQAELDYIYKNAIKNYGSYWHDILEGNNGFPALRGYDFTTGLGSPLSYVGK